MILVLSCSCLCPIHWSQVLSWEWRCSWSSVSGASYTIDLTVSPDITCVAPLWTVSDATIDRLHKSHNAPFPYPTRHHFITEMCTCVHISVTKWCIVGYLPDALWDLWDGSIKLYYLFIWCGQPVVTQKCVPYSNFIESSCKLFRYFFVSYSEADMVGVCINLTKNSKYDIKTDWRN